MEVVEVATPTSSAGEALVRVRAVALNHTDLWTRQGTYGLPEDPEALAGWRGPLEFPLIQGADVAGQVEPVIAATFTLEQAAVAQEEPGRRDHIGKIVLGVDQS